MRGEKTVLGALADSVQEVIELEAKNIEPPPHMGTRVNIDFISGMGKRDEKFLILLDIDRVLSEDETRAVAPATDRARRRVDAEQRLRVFGRRTGTPVTILRIPGIYASDRPGGHPRERLARGTPVLAADDDVYTNHIHADDLARACVAALHRGLPQRIVHASDDTELKMGDYFDLAAGLCGLPRPPRITRAQAREQLAPMALSFMSESRRLANMRLKRELRLVLQYPTVHTGLSA